MGLNRKLKNSNRISNKQAKDNQVKLEKNITKIKQELTENMKNYQKDIIQMLGRTQKETMEKLNNLDDQSNMK